MDVTVRIQYTHAYKVVKQAIVELKGTLKDISPQAFNPNTLLCPQCPNCFFFLTFSCMIG